LKTITTPDPPEGLVEFTIDGEDAARALYWDRSGYSLLRCADPNCDRPDITPLLVGSDDLVKLSGGGDVVFASIDAVPSLEIGYCRTSDCEIVGQNNVTAFNFSSSLDGVDFAFGPDGDVLVAFEAEGLRFSREPSP
jgi:hypothetical protein